MTTDPIAAARVLLEELERPNRISALGYRQVTRELKATVATLADALEAEWAKVAAAYEAAATWLVETGIAGDGDGDPLASCIRDLTPADAQAALDKLLADALLEGWRAGRDAAASVSGHYMTTEADELLCDMWREDILALPEPKETNHDYALALARAAEVSPVIDLLDAMTAEEFTNDVTDFIESGSEQAADALTALQAENQRLREALEHIEQLAGAVGVDLQGRVEGGKVAAVLSIRGIARDALNKETNQ